jgi:hypothetical protein
MISVENLQLHILKKRVFLGICALVVLTLGIALITGKEQAEGQAATPCGGLVYCQDLIGTGQSSPGVKRSGNVSSNNPATGDGNWQVDRIYSDAFYNNSAPSFAYPPPGTPLYPAGSWNNPPTTTCQYFTHGAYPINGIFVDEFAGDTRAGFLPDGGAFPWVASSQGRWLSINYLGWHDGWGPGKSDWPNRTDCDDPSYARRYSFAMPTWIEGYFTPFENWHTYVFRYTPNTGAIPSNVDLSTLRLEMIGAADNHVGVRINNQPMNIQCANRGVNQYDTFGGVSPAGQLWGQGDPAHPFAVPYLPLCTPGFDGFDPTSPNSAMIATQRIGGTFVNGNNSIEIHVKSAYSNMGLLLSQIRLVGNYKTHEIQGRLIDAANIGQGYNGISIETCTGQYPVTSNSGPGNGTFRFTVIEGTGFCIRPQWWPAGAVDARVRPWGEGYAGCPAYGGATASPNYCITTTGNYECQIAGVLVFGFCGVNYDRASNVGYDIAFIFPPPDICANLPGSQPTVPAGYTQRGSDCVLPPTCTATSSATSLWNGQAFTSTVTVTNPNNVAITINQTVFTVNPGGTNQTTPRNNVVGANGGTQPYTSSSVVVGVGAYTSNWAISSDAGGTNCGPPVTTGFVPPTCTANNVTAAVGTNFRSTYSVNAAPGSPAYSIASSSFAYSAAVSGIVPGGVTGAGTVPPAAPPLGQAIDTQVNQPGSYAGALTWTVNWTSPGYATSPLTCIANVTITIAPLTCTALPVNAVINRPFKIRVQLNNPNAIPVSVNQASSSWSFTLPAPGISPTSGAINSTTGWIVGANNGTLAIESLEDITATQLNTYNASWAIESQYTPATDPLNCGNIQAASVSQQPYTRFYGNDVITGGNFMSGGGCVAGADEGALAFGGFNTGAAVFDQSTYLGSASELAIVATGQISGVLPGSQNVRSPVAELAIANSGLPSGYAITIASNSYDFGGGIDSSDPSLCTSEFPILSTPGTPVGPATSLNGLSGNFERNADLTINASAIAISNRPMLVINGNITISGDISYNSTAGWASIDDIPLVRIYATGNIYIDKSVEKLDGLYVAQGNIYTCTNGSTRYNSALAADQLSIKNDCTRQLVVNGAFVAKQVHMLRSRGSVYGIPPTPPVNLESSSSSNIAEVFVFSPEMYLAYLSIAGQGTAVGAFDSILSLPPAF